MKLLAVILFVISGQLHANTLESVYGQGSQLSNELKDEVLEAVLERFPCIDAFGLTEEKTTLRIDQVDQGVRDSYYTTTFFARYHYDFHPNSAQVVVESVRFDGSNPSIDWTDVLSVKGAVLCD